MTFSAKKILTLALAVILAVWAEFYLPGFIVNHDKPSQTQLIAEQARAQPLIDALEEYRADNGFYPTTLAALSPKYLSPSAEPLGFLYSAHSSDRLTNGFRNYELQSENFPADPGFFRIDRWAFYESLHERWSLGWCSHHRRGSRIASNGVCR